LQPKPQRARLKRATSSWFAMPQKRCIVGIAWYAECSVPSRFGAQHVGREQAASQRQIKETRKKERWVVKNRQIRGKQAKKIRKY
jgi:hypothetical protein